MQLHTDERDGVEWVRVDSLYPHPKNALIYGNDEDTTELQIRLLNGCKIVPLEVRADGRIISGHRRWKAARNLGCEEVPVIYLSFDSDEAELEALLVANDTREKTREQKVREAECWRVVEEAKRKKRQGARTDLMDADMMQTFAQGSGVAKTRDAVAKRVGLGSGWTYEKGAIAVREADRLIAIGNTEGAKSILAALNGKGVEAAYRMARPKEEQTARPAVKRKPGRPRSLHSLINDYTTEATIPIQGIAEKAGPIMGAAYRECPAELPAVKEACGVGYRGFTRIVTLCQKANDTGKLVQWLRENAPQVEEPPVRKGRAQVAQGRTRVAS